MGARERKGRERKGKEGKGRERKGKEGKGRDRRDRKGKEGKGRETKEKGRERTEKGRKKEGKGRERKGKEGKGRERKGKEGKGWERKGKEGKGWERKGQEGKGRDRKGKEGKGWERKEKGRERKGKGRERKGKDGKGRDRKGKEGTGRERKGKDGKGRKREGKGREREGKGRERKGKEGKVRERMGKEGKGRERMGKERKRMGKEGKGMERTAADGLGAREWLEMGGEKKPLVMSELGCADGCGRGMGAEKCADGCGWRECNGVAGNGWGEEAAGDERAWLRGRLRTANGCGELRGRLRTAWVQRSGWKWVGRRSRWWWATLAARTAADGKWVRRTARTAADGGVAGNGWGEEAAGDERPWLRGRLRTANGCGELRGRLRTAWVQRSGWKWVGRRSRWWWATLAARTAADGKWVRRTAWTAADGVGARGWLEMGGEKKPLVMSDLGCADGCGRQMGGRTARMAADGVGATEWLEMGGEKGKEGKGWERKGQEGKGRDRKGKEGKGWERKEKGRERKGKEGKGRERKGKEGKGWERKGKDGKGTEKDGKGRERNGADGCGRPGCKGVAGNGWGEEAAGDERAWLRGRLRTGNGCGEVRGRLWMARVQRRGWKRMGRRSRWWWSSVAARTAADGKWVRRTAWTAADGVGATEWLEMGGEKKPLVMSDLGCADGCGRQMGAENCADGCGRRGCKGVAGNGWREEAAGDERPWLRGRLRTANGWENCADGCGWRGCNGVAGNGWGEGKGRERMGKEGTGRERKGQEGKGRERVGKEGKGKGKEGKGRERKGKEGKGRERKGKDGKGRERKGKDGKGTEKDGKGRERNGADGCGRPGCKGVAGNGWGEEAAGDERAWLRGRLRTGNGCGEVRGRLWMARVQRRGWKWMGRRSRWWWASVAARTAADGKWVRRTAWTAADGVGATEWLEMGGEKKPLVMSDLGCADGCGRQMGAENCADGCGRRGCKGVAGNGWREEAAGDERPWLRGRLRTANGCGELRGRLRTAWVQRSGWKWVGRRSRWWWATLAARTAADGKWVRRTARTAADGGVAGNGWGEEAAGDERPWLRGRLRTANGCGELRGRLRTAGWLEMGGEKKPLVMSDLGCADGCGRQMGAENCVDGCGRRGCNGVAGNGWGEEAAGDERPWLRGRLRTANGCGELRGRLRTAWVQGGSWKWVGRRSRWWWATLAARTAADGKWVGELRGWLRMAWVQRSGWKWVGRRERKGKDGKGRDRKGKEGTGRERKGQEGKGRERMGKEKGRERKGKGRERKGKEGKGRERMGKEGKGRERMGKERKRMGKEGKGMERTAADGLGAREWLEMGGEKKPLVMSELGCADGCGRGMGAEKCADGCGRQMGAENCVDGCGRRGCNGVAGNGWGEEAAGDERPWLRGRLRTANGCRELRGRLRTAWVQGGGWKWVERRSRWWWATLAARTAADGKWVRRTAWTAADGVGATEWLEMGGEKKPLVMSDLGCADRCGRQMGAENCADGCGRRGCKGVAGNGWGEEAAGDERPWLRGRLRTANGCGELRGWLRTGVGATEWLEMGGEKKPLVMSDLGCVDGCGREMGAENCADGCGRHRCNGVAGNGWGEEAAAGDERPWLRGRLRTGKGCGELRRRLRMAWVQRSGWKLWVRRRSRWWWASLAARTAADGKWVGRIARTAADGVGAREWLEIGGEKKPLEISQLGCADGCGREMGAENCADGCGRRGKWARRRSRWRSASVAARTAADGVGATEWLEMGGEKKPLEISELGCADGCGREMGAENCADGCGRRGCNGVAGNGWREDAAGDERAWLRGGCGRQMGAENCADGCGRRGGWKWVGNRSRWWWASLAARTAADGKWVGRIARTAAVGVGAREWLEIGGEKKPLVMSERGCADGELCGQPRTAWVQGSGWKWFGRRSRWGWASLAARTAVDGKWVGWIARTAWVQGGNGRGEEAAGDQRAWLRGRLQTAWVQGLRLLKSFRMPFLANIFFTFF